MSACQICLQSAQSNKENIAAAQSFSHPSTAGCCLSKAGCWCFSSSPKPGLRQALHPSGLGCCGINHQARPPGSCLCCLEPVYFSSFPCRCVWGAVIHPAPWDVFLSYFLEALAVWGRLLGHEELLDTVHSQHQAFSAGWNSLKIPSAL